MALFRSWQGWIAENVLSSIPPSARNQSRHGAAQKAPGRQRPGIFEEFKMAPRQLPVPRYSDARIAMLNR
ncbi:hypothetical protein [Rhizobium tumorigenes]|uniref:hypothetical protein n=1 Tax=Rhizobium tumorigenes TaxID=2041385 RepID=UPI00241DEB19|nr:hypothetical protein [Rhizobium tumorigenes]WFS01777.1 hypothetical protein PR016_03865 [Rhizobium tumorigenes]